MRTLAQFSTVQQVQQFNASEGILQSLTVSVTATSLLTTPDLSGMANYCADHQGGLYGTSTSTLVSFNDPSNIVQGNFTDTLNYNYGCSGGGGGGRPASRTSSSSAIIVVPASQAAQYIGQGSVPLTITTATSNQADGGAFQMTLTINATYSYDDTIFSDDFELM